MMLLKEDFFKYYLFSYLNRRVANSKNISLKKHNIAAIKNYLNLEKFPEWTSNIFIWIVIHFELPITILIEIIGFVKLILLKAFNKKEYIHNSLLYLGIREQRLKRILQNAHIAPESLFVVTFPFTNSRIFDDFKKIKLISGLTVRDVCKAFAYAIQISCFMSKKYGRTDCLFRSYSSFYFFLSCFFFYKLDNSNKVVYTSTYSRWGYLFGHLKIKTIFLQHGMLGCNLPFLIKTGSPDIGFFLNEEEMVNCCRQLFSNNPEVRYLDGLKFTSNEKLMNNGKKNILVVCNLIHFEKEESMVRNLHKIGSFNIYLKPHPLDSYFKYEKLMKEIPFVILSKTDYPKVDLVVSYNSTLAIEYRDAGITVIWHDNKTADEIVNEINRKFDARPRE